MLSPWASGSKEVLIGFSNVYLCLKDLAQAAAKLWTLKVGGQKYSRRRSYNLHFEHVSYSDLLLIGRPAFESRLLQTLRASNFKAL